MNTPDGLAANWDVLSPARAEPGAGPGRYEVLGEHARGGLGRIMKARDVQLGRIVAIKELLRVSAFAESLFMREALITARLQHPGIVPVHETGRWPSGEPFYVMKLVSGKSLAELVRRDGNSTLAERLALLPSVTAVAKTVAYAHQEGVIHRDIKPANIIVGEFGETMMVDWGLARDDRQHVPLARDLAAKEIAARVAAATGATASESDTVWLELGNYSVSGKVIGTPAYMAPEQGRGAEVDTRADVYSIGAVLYELLAGRPPYPGKDPQVVLEKVLAGPPVPLDEVAIDRPIPPDLVTIVRKAMARNPAERYPSALELAEDLERFQTGKLVSAHAYSTFTLVRRWLWRHRGVVAMASVALAVLMVMAVLGVDRIVKERNVAREQRSQAEQRKNQLLLMQARSSLDRDPTATIAWLKLTALDDDMFREARSYHDQAIAQGVARHVISFPDAVEVVLPTPDGKHVIAASRDGTLRAVDLATGALRVIDRSAEMHYFRTAALSPDGRWLAGCSKDGLIRLIELDDASSAVSARTLRGYTNWTAELQFTTDGLLASWAQDGTARTWNMRSGQLVSTYSFSNKAALSHDGALIAHDLPGGRLALATIADEHVRWRVPLPGVPAHIIFSPDDRLLVVQQQDGKVKLVDVATGAVSDLGETGSPDWTDRPQFSPSGQYMATADWSGAIFLWQIESDAATGKLIRTLRGHDRPIFDMTFFGEERYLASASDDGTARIWDLKSDHVRVLAGHDDDVASIAIGGGDHVATGSFDGTVRIWNIAAVSSQTLVGPDGGLMRPLRFTDDGKVITAGSDGVLRRWDGERDEREVLSSSLPVLPEATKGVRFSPGNRWLAQDNPDERKISLRNLVTGTITQLEGYQEPVIRAAFSGDEEFFATLHENGSLLVWRLSSPGAPSQKIDPIWPGPACGVGLSPSGDQLLVASAAEAALVDVATRQVTARFAIPDDGGCNLKRRRMVVFAVDGSWVAVSGVWSGIVLWDMRSRSAVSLDTDGQQIFEAISSPDSAYLAATLEGRRVTVWNAPGGDRRLTGKHDDLALWLEFAPDSHLLASASHDRTVRLWDMASGEVQVLRGHDNVVFSMLFSPDSKRLVTASTDRTTRIWELDKLATPSRAELAARLARATSARIDSKDRARSPMPSQGCSSTPASRLFPAERLACLVGVSRAREQGPGRPDLAASEI